jgi:hypothetical protein
MAGDDEIVGAITHVFNYQDDPSLIQAWFDYLESGDASGERNMTVSELLDDQPDPLEADVVSISAITGGSVGLTLFSDASLAGDLVLFLPSLSGSDPGYAYGGVYDTGVHIGINIDTLTLVALKNLSASWLSGFFGTLDSAGGASATFVAPAALPPSIVGSSLTFTAIASGSAFSQLDFSANPVSVAITP